MADEQEGVWRKSGIATLIHSLGTRRPGRFWHRKKSPLRGEPGTWCGYYGEEWNLFPWLGIEPRSLGFAGRCLATTPTTLSRAHIGSVHV